MRLARSALAISGLCAGGRSQQTLHRPRTVLTGLWPLACFTQRHPERHLRFLPRRKEAVPHGPALFIGRLEGVRFRHIHVATQPMHMDSGRMLLDVALLLWETGERSVTTTRVFERLAPPQKWQAGRSDPPLPQNLWSGLIKT